MYELQSQGSQAWLWSYSFSRSFSWSIRRVLNIKGPPGEIIKLIIRRNTSHLMKLCVPGENCLRASDTAQLPISRVETETKRRQKKKKCDPESIDVGITKLHRVSWFPRERFPPCQTSLSSRAQCYLSKANLSVYFRPQRRPNWVWATQSHLSGLLSHYTVPSWHLGLGPSTYVLVIKELTYPNSHNLNTSWSGSRGQMWKRVLTHKVRRSQFINVQPCLSLVTST